VAPQPGRAGLECQRTGWTLKKNSSGRAEISQGRKISDRAEWSPSNVKPA